MGMLFTLHSYGQHTQIIKVGDYIYTDGTTSSNKLDSKECIGIIIANETNENDKVHGFHHGVAMALNDTGNKKRYSWGPYGEYNDKKEYRYEKADSLSEAFEAFEAVKSMSVPYFHNSGWMLPSPEHWEAMLRNIGLSDKLDWVHRLERLYSIMNFTHEEFNSDIGYWLSTSSSGRSAKYGYSGGVVSGDYVEPYKGFMGDKSKKKKVRAVLVF